MLSHLKMCLIITKTVGRIEKLTKDSDPTARIIGVASQMATFDFYFGVCIGEMILRHSGNLSRTLQKK